MKTQGKAETMECTYEDLQRDMASRGFMETPITQEEYSEIVDSGVGHVGAVSIALDVASGFSMHGAWQAYVEDLIETSHALTEDS